MVESWVKIPVDFDIVLPEVWVPPTPEVIDVPADLPTLDPAVTIRLPLNEEITSAVLVPGEHEDTSGGGDVLYVAVTQERVNIWAAVVYFMPEIAIGLSTLLLLIALRRLWVRRRFTHKPGEAYCKKCWAGLTGVESDTCPECGRPVKKVKRVTKHRVFRLTWAWCTAAVFAILCTTTIWFGESWKGLPQRGFDYQSSRDWWSLIDPLDRDSAFRLNRAAYLLDWKSAKLAAFARERDQAWIDKVIWEYDDRATGGDYHLLIRRYSVADGTLLGEYPLPAESIEQDAPYTSAARIQQINGVLLVNDGASLFRLRPEIQDPWLQLGGEDNGDWFFDAAVSSDGKLIFLIMSYDNGQGLWDPHPSQLELHAVDPETGEVRYRVVFSPEERERDAPLRITRQDSHNPPTVIINDYYREMVPLATGGRLLLALADDSRIFSDPTIHYARCDFKLNQFEEVGIDSVAQTELRYDCTLYGYGQLRANNLFQSEVDADFSFYEIVEAKQNNVRWAASDALIGARDNGGLFGPYFPGKIYNPYRDILLYDLDQGVVPDQPARVLTIQHPQATGVCYSWVSRRDRWLVAEFDHGPSLLLHRDTAKPAAWIPTPFRKHDSNCYLYGFANNGQQAFAVHFEQPTPAPQHTFFDRHEIVIFDLPDAAE